ncbi:hypothetical protein VTG60DRAFT_4732 [Thermothelomyces hinnuleus]
MPELLLQSALTTSRSQQLAAEAAEIRSSCRDRQGDHKSLVTCPQCYEAVLDAFRSRYLGSSPNSGAEGPGSGQKQQAARQEWFASRPAFVSALNLLVDSAKEYQISPREIDDRVREERARWYAERVRSLLLRLMVEDPSGRGAVFEKLEDLSSGDAVALAREVADILSKGPFAPEQGTAEGVAEKLLAASASDETADKAEVFREAFFTAEDGTVPEDHQKYLDLLLHQGLSMEQVVDRILEERQTATGAREQTEKLNQRLDELRRARAAHEAQKTRKAQRRESLAQQKVPDELYELPACAVCGGETSTEEYFTCSICTILAGAGVQDKTTVFCSEKCEQQSHPSHAATHTCSSGLSCIQLREPHRQTPKETNTSSNGQNQDQQQDMPMTDAPPLANTGDNGGDDDGNNNNNHNHNDDNDNSSSSSSSSSSDANELHFCTECLTCLKQPTTWCSLACADASFPSHREEVHLPLRKKLGLGETADEAQLESIEPGAAEDDGRGRYRVKDIRAVTTSLGDAVKEWEGRNKVRLQGLV